MNRLLVLSFVLFVSVIGRAQTKANFPLFEHDGGIEDISISPEGKIWAVTNECATYYRNAVDSNWRTGEPLMKADRYTWSDALFIKGPFFFNKDTAIVTGYGHERNGTVFLTENGGKSWNVIKHNRYPRVYSADYNSTGQVWMGTDSMQILYSQDFGQSWIPKLLPGLQPALMGPSIRYIDMITSVEGYASTSEDELLYTTDNWITFLALPTPNYQKKYVPKNSYTDVYISNIQLWGEYLVIMQNGIAFYSKKDKLDWKRLPAELNNFIVDQSTLQLFGTDEKHQVFRFDSPTKYIQLTKMAVPENVQLLRTSNGTLYAFGESETIYEFHPQKGLIAHPPYAAEKKITPPDVIVKGEKLHWGKTGTRLFVSYSDGNDWERAYDFPYFSEDLKIINDSVVSVWNTEDKLNVHFDLRTGKAEPTIPKLPLDDFLKYPIKEVKINSGWHGCFGGSSDNITYSKVDSLDLPNRLVTKYLIHDKNGGVWKESDSTFFVNDVGVAELESILRKINTAPTANPTIADFDISKSDILQYRSDLATRLQKAKNTEEDGVIYDLGQWNTIPDMKFYESFPSKLNKVSDQQLGEVVSAKEPGRSTSTHSFEIQIINSNNDVIKISYRYHFGAIAWNLPMEFNYNKTHFLCKNAAFAKYIGTCLPESFDDREVFSNSLLIMNLADYLYNSKK